MAWIKISDRNEKKKKKTIWHDAGTCWGDGWHTYLKLCEVKDLNEWNYLVTEI